jgi:hypothetical protein
MPVLLASPRRQARIRKDISSTRLIEISGGFGGMARSHCVLALPLADRRLADYKRRTGLFSNQMLGRERRHTLRKGDRAAAAEVLPYWGFFERNLDYWFVFNSSSLPEIRRDRVDECLAEIELRGAKLLSINHEDNAPIHLNLHQIIVERGKLECHFRHPYWIRKGFIAELFMPSGL